MAINIKKSPIKLYASAKAVINNYLFLPGKDRVKHIVERVEAMTDEQVAECTHHLMQEFGHRHRNLTASFLHHFHTTEIKFSRILSHFPDQKKVLLGAFLTKEYSIQSAALFNPSIVPHPDQNGLEPGEQRFVMSLRSTGEGHISSISFKTGIINTEGEIRLDPNPLYYTCLQKKEDTLYNKAFLYPRAMEHEYFDVACLDKLPESFTAKEAHHILVAGHSHDASLMESLRILDQIFDTNYELADSAHIELNEKVIFPSAKGEIMGMEDVRLVRFEDKDAICYYGTYTAYDGKHIKTQLIETRDFHSFKTRTLFGKAISDKGMALFPEKIQGKYVMISRQGGENISIMFSDDIYKWDTAELLMQPKYDWEMVQLGNCGSPIKTTKGWLLLTHGVGVMRKYVISAILLDLEDPRQIVGRLEKPFLEADENEREGYVPNVVYTCGLLLHGDVLLIPYAVSDAATGFITVKLNDMLDELLTSGS